MFSVTNTPPTPASPSTPTAGGSGLADPKANPEAPIEVSPKALKHQELAERFRHHPPKGDQASRYGDIRAKILECADYCCDRTPPSREQQRALEKLDEAMFLFNTAIARCGN